MLCIYDFTKESVHFAVYTHMFTRLYFYSTFLIVQSLIIYQNISSQWRGHPVYVFTREERLYTYVYTLVTAYNTAL